MFHFGSSHFIGTRTVAAFPPCMCSEYSVLASPSIAACKAAAVSHIKSGKLRALANTGATRSPLLPEVPTVAESGLKDYAVATWFGLLGPAGMPSDLVARIQRDVAGALATPDMRNRLVDLGVDIVGNSPEEFAAYLRTEITRYAKVIKDAGIKP